MAIGFYRHGPRTTGPKSPIASRERSVRPSVKYVEENEIKLTQQKTHKENTTKNNVVRILMEFFWLHALSYLLINSITDKRDRNTLFALLVSEQIFRLTVDRA